MRDTLVKFTLNSKEKKHLLSLKKWTNHLGNIKWNLRYQKANLTIMLINL